MSGFVWPSKVMPRHRIGEAFCTLLLFLINNYDEPIELRGKAVEFFDKIVDLFNEMDSDDEIYQIEDFDEYEAATISRIFTHCKVDNDSSPVASIVFAAYKKYIHDFCDKFNGARHFHDRLFEMIDCKARSSLVV